MSSRSTFSRDLLANETVADWLDALGIAAAYQPIDPTLTALAGYKTNGLVTQTAADTFAGRSIAVSGTGLAISNADGVSGNPTITITPSAVVGAVGTIPAAAVQADQETATSTTTYVAPGTQQFHPSAAKCWAFVTVSAGTPSVAASYNITSITDTGVGRLTISIGTDFSSANWAHSAAMEPVSAVSTSMTIYSLSKAAGSIELDHWREGSGLVDPVSWSFAGWGDQ